MTTWIVTRHPGAVEWARQRGMSADRVAPHLDPQDVQAGDTVAGTLPVHLAAAVCRRGARYLHLSIDVPAAWRGRELSAAELDAANARLEPFLVGAAKPPTDRSPS